MSYVLRGGYLLDEICGSEVAPLIAIIARNHVPPACLEDFLDFVWTGCATDQLKMIIRYMGGTEPALEHIEIEERGGRLYATGNLTKGISWMKAGIMLPPAKLPQTILDALPGRPLSQLVEHPLLPADAVITRVMGKGGPMIVDLHGDEGEDVDVGGDAEDS